MPDTWIIGIKYPWHGVGFCESATIPAFARAHMRKESSAKQCARAVRAPGNSLWQYATTSSTVFPCEDPGKKLGCQPCSINPLRTASLNRADGFVRKTCAG